MNLIVYSHVRLNTNVSIQIIYFPGFSSIMEFCDILPSFNSIDAFLPFIAYSLNSSSFPIIEFIVIYPFLGTSYFFYFFLAGNATSFLISISLFFWISYSSFSFLVLKTTSA